MHCEGFRRQQPGPIWAVNLACIKETEKTSTEGVRARMRTRHFLNTSQKHYPPQHSCWTQKKNITNIKKKKKKKKAYVITKKKTLCCVCLNVLLRRVNSAVALITTQNTTEANYTNSYLWSYSFRLFRHFHLNLVTNLSNISSNNNGLWNDKGPNTAELKLHAIYCIYPNETNFDFQENSYTEHV
jgi:hypothetical protein